MSELTRQCKACGNPVPANSIKCENCGDWREDIKKERNLCYLWSFVAFVPIILFLYGKGQGWWTSWARRGMLGIIGPTPAFDWGVFFSSSSGLTLIIVFGVVAALSLKYYVSVSQKMGNWFWL